MDSRKDLPSLVQPTDYYPLLVFQIGSKEEAANNQEGPQGLGTTGQGM